MTLVTWNDELTDGIGRSGTRYNLSYGSPPHEPARALWRIGADDAFICAVESVEQAVLHAEALEALRCMARGLNCRLSDDQLRGASVIAGEMMEATKTALQAAIDSSWSELLQNAQALGSLCDAIGQERVRRQQEDNCSPLPLPN